MYVHDEPNLIEGKALDILLKEDNTLWYYSANRPNLGTWACASRYGTEHFHHFILTQLDYMNLCLSIRESKRVSKEGLSFIQVFEDMEIWVVNVAGKETAVLYDESRERLDCIRFLRDKYTKETKQSKSKRPSIKSTSTLKPKE